MFAIRDGEGVRLVSRRGLDWQWRFHHNALALLSLKKYGCTTTMLSARGVSKGCLWITALRHSWNHTVVTTSPQRTAWLRTRTPRR
jgi:hypothetical protein